MGGPALACQGGPSLPAPANQPLPAPSPAQPGKSRSTAAVAPGAKPARQQPMRDDHCGKTFNFRESFYWLGR